ncbi:MAG: phosphatidylinositol transfer protein, partial [Polyangiaceae bacterium]
PPSCSAAAPDPGPARAGRHGPGVGAPNHRGRDNFFNPGAPQWIIGNFQYGLGPLEGGLQDEEVDIYLLRDCGSTWEKLGTALTTGATPAHPKTEGVDDAPGRIFFEIPSGQALGKGRHRVRLVVAGDLTAVDMFIEVVDPNTPVFVADMDGTLTDSEAAQALAILTGTVPNANPDAAVALTVLASKGYRPMYLTARPEWLVKVSQDWIVAKGFPPGILHTTLVGGGASGPAAVMYKSEELALLAQNKMMKPTYAIGNTETDAEAYNNGGIMPLTNRLFFLYTDTVFMGRRIETYTSIIPEFSGLPLVCR